MIKVLMIGNHPSNKGGMTSVINQIKAYNWEKKGVDLSCVPTIIHGNPVKKICFFAVSYLKILFRFVTAKPDILHMHMSYKGSFSRKNAIHKLCRLFKVKDIIHLHGSEFEKWFNEIDDGKKNKVKRLLSECDSFIVLGEGWKRIVQNIEPSAKVTVLSNGIAIPDDTVQWNENQCQLLFLGVLISRKGIPDLIKAVSVIRDKKNNNIKCVIAGSGEEEENLKKQVKEAKLEDFISFAGWIEGAKKRKLILDSQILVSPSYNEGLPISILEAASFGMPVISSDVGDVSSVVHDGVNGYLFSPGDVNALATAIEKTAVKDTFIRMSRESKQIVEESFSIDSFYRKLLDIYRSLGEVHG